MLKTLEKPRGKYIWTLKQVIWLLRNYGLLREGCRDAGERTGYTDQVNVLGSGFVGPANFVINAEKAADLFRRLEELEPPMPAVLLLKFTYGYTYGELARLMKIPHETLRRHTNETLDKLRQNRLT